ncbi:MAG: 6-phosphofructokinase [Bacteroidota bacterium]
MAKIKIKKIGVLTSGGDAPGMNACIRSVVRTALYYKKQVVGINRGYQGLISDETKPMNSRSVSNIIHRGGTILKTARCLEFKTEKGMLKAYKIFKKHQLDALIVIGGDGSFKGAEAFSNKFEVPVIGVPGTIDNDLYGTDYTIGFDTATNTTIEAIDKIRDTAASHNRLFFIEVMGRDSGCIALWSGIAGGSEAVLLPEKETSVKELITKLQLGAKNKKSSSIVIVAEGEHGGGAMKIAEMVQKKIKDYDTKVTILGHLQRGGSPSCFDRVLASRLGSAAVEALINGENKKMVGLVDNKIKLTDLKMATSNHFELDDQLIKLANMLST